MLALPRDRRVPPISTSSTALLPSARYLRAQHWFNIGR
jgi:hypothetical protein